MRVIILIAVLGMAGCYKPETATTATVKIIETHITCTTNIGCISRVRIEQDNVTCYGTSYGISCLKDTDQ